MFRAEGEGEGEGRGDRGGVAGVSASSDEQAGKEAEVQSTRTVVRGGVRAMRGGGGVPGARTRTHVLAHHQSLAHSLTHQQKSQQHLYQQQYQQQQQHYHRHHQPSSTVTTSNCHQHHQHHHQDQSFLPSFRSATTHQAPPNHMEQYASTPAAE